MAPYGKVHNVTIKQIEWLIHNFFALQDKCYGSPPFSFANESWSLVFIPKCGKEKNVEDVVIGLYRITSGPPIHLTAFFNLKSVDGKKAEDRKFHRVFMEHKGIGMSVLLKRSSLLQVRDKWVPSDILTVVWTMELSKSPDDTGNAAECSYCEEYFDDKYLSSHELKCLDKPINCPTCEDSLLLKKWFNHECDMGRVRATKRLIGDLENILESKEHYDVIIKVENSKFYLHKSILAARSLYFSSKLAELKDKKKNTIIIDDCGIDAFHIYALYIYTGKIPEMNVENVCKLYSVADKFQEDQLKEECICFIKSKMSAENFCDFITLALKLDDEELLQYGSEFFNRKMKEIVQNDKWPEFMREYPKQANEMYIKAYDSK